MNPTQNLPAPLNKTVFILLGLSAFLHFLYLLTPPLDSDSALAGLMAIHIGKGEFPIFFYSGHYGGTLEAYLTSVVFFILGPSRYSLPLALVIEFILFCWLHYLWVRNLLPPAASLFSLAWISLGPPLLFTMSSIPYLEYMWLLFWGMLILYKGTDLIGSVSKKFVPDHLFVILGLASGLAWWVQFQVLYFIIPVGLMALPAFFSSDRKHRWGLLLIFFLIGSLPFWVYNLGHGGISLGEAHKFTQSISFKESFFFLFFSLPIVFGFWNIDAPWDYKPFTPGPVIPIFSNGLVLILILFFFLFLVSQIKKELSFYSKTKIFESPLKLPFAFLFIFIILYGLSGIAGEKAYRHFVPLYVVIPLFLGKLIEGIKQWNKALGWSLAVLLLASNLLGAFTLMPIFDAIKLDRFQFIQNEKKSLSHYLDRNQIRHVYHFNYWIGTLLTFEAKEKIIFSNPLEEKYPQYIKAVREATKVGYLFANQRETYFENSLAMMGVTFKFKKIGRLFLYHDFNKEGGVGEELGNLNWRGFSQVQPTGTFYAFDRNPATAWTSRVTQDTGQFFQFDLGKVHPRGITIRMGAGRPQEIPESIDLLSSIDGYHWKIIFSGRERFFLPLDWVKGNPAYIKGRETLFWDLPEEPVRFVQFIITKKSLHPAPWIIPEIRVYQK